MNHWNGKHGVCGRPFLQIWSQIDWYVEHYYINESSPLHAKLQDYQNAHAKRSSM